MCSAGARYLAARLEFATGTFKPSNHSPVMRFAPTTQELLGVVVAEVAQAGESLGDERAVSGWAQSTSMQWRQAV